MDLNNNIQTSFKSRFAKNLFKQLYLNADTADVFFILKSNENGQMEKIPGHKCLMGAAHPVFNAMFFGQLKETGDVEIIDASAEAFKEFLQFFYLNKVTLTPENIGDVLNLAKKYEIRECSKQCGAYLMKTLDIDDMCWGYENALFFEEENLMNFCEKNIQIHTEETFKSNSFLNCDWTTLKRILGLRLLCPEFEVFRACIKWSEAACERQNLEITSKRSLRVQLKDLLFRIRYENIPNDIFNANINMFRRLFTVNELITISLMVKGSMEMVSETFIPRTMQSFDWDESEILVCNRVLRHETSGSELQKYDQTTFKCNQLLLWCKLLCGSLFNCYEQLPFNGMPARVTITQVPNERIFTNLPAKVMFETKIKLSMIEGKLITLPEPIVVKPDYKYEIQIENLSKKSFHSNHLLTREKDFGNNCKIHFLCDSMIDNPRNGLVTCLYFNRLSK